MVKNEFIVPSKTTVGEVVLVVKNQNGTFRFSADYRRINAMTIPESYLIWHIYECLDVMENIVLFLILEFEWGT